MQKTTSDELDPTVIRPNWSAFVILIVLLSVLNSLFSLLPLSSNASEVLVFINYAFSLILWADFFYLLGKSPDKRHFMIDQRGWLVLLGSFPFLRALRLVWFQMMLKRRGKSIRDFLSSIVIKQNAEGTLLLFIFITIVVFEIATISILNFEAQHPGSNITSISDAIWWTMVTVATVGYGDTYPVTTAGRLIGILLMGIGVALFSIVTSSLVEWFRDRQVSRPIPIEFDDQISNSDRIAAIKTLLEQQEESYLQTIADLKAGLAELESRME